MNVAGNGIKSVELTIKVLDKLMEFDGARVTEIANALDIAPSTAHNHLTTLEQNAFVVKEGDFYFLSMEFAKMGRYVKTRKPGYKKAKSRVESLAEETGGRAHFAVEEQGMGRYVYTSTGNMAVKTFTAVGVQFPLHVTAAGKAILASIPESRLLEIVERRGLTRMTQNSITDLEALTEELEKTREREYAINMEEHMTGIRAVAVPVFEPTGNVLGSLTISAPARRMKGSYFREELPQLLLELSDELELDIRYS